MRLKKKQAWTHARLHPINTIKPRKKTVNHLFNIYIYTEASCPSSDFWAKWIVNALSLWLSTEAVAFSPRPHPYLPCFAPLSRERLSLCTALQTKILWINWSLNAIDTIETWVSGNLTALTGRSQPAIRWRVGEVANRVSCSSVREGHWYLPIRNHDNRYFADWIRLCPGLSKNSENGNSCPKPHKAARMIEAVGRAVSIETEL